MAKLFADGKASVVWQHNDKCCLCDSQSLC